MKRAAPSTRQPHLGSDSSVVPRRACVAKSAAAWKRYESAILLDDGSDAPYWELAERIARGRRIRGHAF